MEGDHGLPCPGRPCDASGAAIFALDQFALCRMKEDRPLFPRVLERALQFLHIGHETEAALRIRVGEGIGRSRQRDWARRYPASRELQQRLGGFPRQMVSELEE